MVFPYIQSLSLWQFNNCDAYFQIQDIFIPLHLQVYVLETLGLNDFLIKSF